MYNTERAWRSRFATLPRILQLKFLTEENAYFRSEERARRGIPGTDKDDWYWAVEYVNFTWPHIVIAALYPPIVTRPPDPGLPFELRDSSY